VRKKPELARELPSPFVQIAKNEYGADWARPRRPKDADDLDICSCKVPVPPADGSGPAPVACGSSCLNRCMLIECTPSLCPTGKLCTNQRFQRRMYAKTLVRHFGAKGWGVVARAPIAKGEFVFEYCGEVLDESAMRERLKSYTAGGELNAYLLTLSPTETIDATVKGNISRYVNHSCEPNCETQKWYARTFRLPPPHRSR
jgi:hypothetical protein